MRCLSIFDKDTNVNELFLMELTEGNIGAATFVNEGINKVPTFAIPAFTKMKNNNITGVKLYLFWNDCCNRDTNKAIKIILDNDIEDIKEHIKDERGIPYE